MCGILGIISNADRSTSISTDDVVAMRDTMSVRGPDGAGLFRQGRVTLAHRRLAIRDPAHGQQPLVSQDGRFVIVFNGEIYNDDELGKLLEHEGVSLRTHCDTEALVEAWSVWGQDCLEKIRGMYAFAITDQRSGEVWLVRDRCGVKPLYYANIDHEFVFASSIAAIKRHPRFSAQPNFPVIRHYLQTLRLTLDRETVFKGIYSVRPAEVIHVAGNRLNHRTYWTLPEASDYPIGFEEAVFQLESAIEDSVKVRLKSDVPVGMMLSGGVDSNTLATFARRQNSDAMVGVCGGGVDPVLPTQGGDFDFAHQCARELGFDYSEIRIGGDHYLETWTSLIDRYETPVATPTDAIIYHVARQLKQTVGVAIGGEGADEAFCGYTIAHWSGNDFDQSSRLSGWGESTANEARQSLMKQYGRDHFSSAADHYLATSGLIPKAAQRALFHPDVWAEADAGGSTERHYGRLFSTQGDRPMAEKYARVLFQVNLESLLGRLDSATMAAGLEARVPYTDHHLVEQAFRIPHHYKIDVCPNEHRPWLSSQELAERGSLRSKRVLRAVASKLLPRRLALRPKMSFPTPVPTWLDRDWKSWITDKLTQSPFAKEVFQENALQEMTQLPQSLAMWNWPVLNTVLWGDRCFS